MICVLLFCEIIMNPTQLFLIMRGARRLSFSTAFTEIVFYLIRDLGVTPYD